MSTIIELPQDIVDLLEQRSQEEHVSRDEIVRRALATHLSTGLSSVESDAEGDASSWPELKAVFGTWTHGDGLAYQLRMRAEWDREWD